MNIFTKLAMPFVLFVAICGHAYTGTYCNDLFEDICLQINPGGKAQIAFDGINITGSYIKNGDNISVTLLAPTSTATKNLIVEQMKKRMNNRIDEKIYWECDRVTKSGERYNGKIYGYSSFELSLCQKDSEQHFKNQRQEIKVLKYSDDLFEEWRMKFNGMCFDTKNFTLYGNSLHSDCSPLFSFTKSGSKPSTLDEYGLFCANDIMYKKCNGKTYNPEYQKCENNTLLDKCGNEWYNYEAGELSCVPVGRGYKLISKNTKAPNESVKSLSNDAKTSIIRDTTTASSDAKEYKTVKIGDQTWMAKNLDIDVAGSQCYKNDPANCSKYGRLYNWETAIKICPKGWHLPSEAEWGKLAPLSFSARMSNPAGGTKLRTKSGWSSWNNKPVIRGTDDFGFSALPGGSCNSSGNCSSIGNTGFWWTATEKNNKNAVRLYMSYDNENVSNNNEDKSSLHSVRCIQN